MRAVGFRKASDAIWLSSVVAFFNFFGCFFGFFFVEKYGRRPLALTSLFLVIICLVLIGVAYYVAEITTPKSTNNSSSISGSCSEYTYCFDCIQDTDCGYCSNIVDSLGGGSACIKDNSDDINTLCSSNSDYYTSECPNSLIKGGWAIFVFMNIYLLCFSSGMGKFRIFLLSINLTKILLLHLLGPMPWCVNSEIYPTHVRGAGVSLSTATNWTVNLVMSLTFLTAINAFTFPVTFVIYAALSFGFWLFFLHYLPETRGLQLEEISQLFSDHSWGRLFSVRQWLANGTCCGEGGSLLIEEDSDSAGNKSQSLLNNYAGTKTFQ